MTSSKKPNRISFFLWTVTFFFEFNIFITSRKIFSDENEI